MTTATATKPRKRATKKANTKAKPAKKTTAKKKATSDANVRPTAAELKAKETELRKKYPRIVVGSIRDIETKKGAPHYNKMTVEITCAKRGCNEVRRIATSDLHQVTMCEEHTLEQRRANRRAARLAAKKANTKKKAPSKKPR